MIPQAELLALRSEWQLRADVIEKDYVLGWLLAGIANEPELSQSWIFKGGTCLRKCYFETYRLSEDLDFTVVSGGPEEPADLHPIFMRVAAWLRSESGLELEIDEHSFTRRRNLRGNPTTEGRMAYKGPNNPPNLPKFKVDLTSDELLAFPAELRTISHEAYSDSPLPSPSIRCYSLAELCAEKIRALAQRCRPRDLYDVVQMSRHPDLVDRARLVAQALEQKSAFVGMPTPVLTSVLESPLRAEIEQEWENMLGHQLPPPVAPFSEFWNALEYVFSWLTTDVRPPILVRAESEDLDPAWIAPRAMTSWRTGAPLELVRYAGANRLKVEIDYIAKDGRRGPRVVEPYSLRRTKDGRLLLFVVNDRGQLRAYRVDRITGIRPTGQVFQPRYLVEF